MPVNYRALRANEEDSVLSLWAEVFDAPVAYFERYFAQDSYRRVEHTGVAVAEDGQLLSAVHLCLREVRDARGAPQRVGCVANVVTRREARNQGHSGWLLEWSVQAMQDEGCAWSLLYTGTNRHYARYGWRTLPTPFRQGAIDPNDSVPDAKLDVHPYAPAHEPHGWERLAAVYDAFNARRPLTVFRPLNYWRGFGARLFTEPRSVVFVARPTPDDHDLSGYLLFHLVDAEVRLLEIGWQPGADDCAGALLAAARQLAVERGVLKVTASLPFQPEIDQALQRAAIRMETKHHHAAMVRAIAADLDPALIDAAFAVPGAIFWNADGF